ncbi:MAG TPA: tetraacyldisaccharide 4'-kinase [Beijerinckiaceae bacterium]|nr:tetraacyldisaccharide 4'-kinase [Beijerinckiaceae bacterium]
MKAPTFWWDRTPGAIARLLMPFGWLYGTITTIRMKRAGYRAPVPVLCIGNFTAGGAGKTPTTIALAEAMAAGGEFPVILTRGYGGTARGVTVVVPAIHDARTVGDEALLLARIAPTVVASDRVAGAEAAARAGASVILMDDGLQNPSLAKDVSIAVVDGAVGFGNGLCLPAGPLRAPVEQQAPLVDALVAIGMGHGLTQAVAAGSVSGRPVFRAELGVSDAVAEQFAGKRVLAFAGIGRPEKFFDTLMSLYVKIEIARPFGDHHAYSDAEAEELMATAAARGLALVTTSKDHVRLAGSPALERLKAATEPLPVQLTLPDGLIALVRDRISLARGGGSAKLQASHRPPDA